MAFICVNSVKRPLVFLFSRQMEVEVFPDRYFHSHWTGGRLHSRSGLQYERGPQGQGEKAVYPPADCGGSRRRVTLVIAEFFPYQLIAIFGASNESTYYTEFAVKVFRVYLCMMILACVNKGTFIYLQSLGEAMASTLLSMVCEIIFGVGFALILPVFFGLDGVLYSMPVSDVLTFLIAAVLIGRTYRELRQ